MTTRRVAFAAPVLGAVMLGALVAALALPGRTARDDAPPRSEATVALPPLDDAALGFRASDSVSAALGALALELDDLAQLAQLGSPLSTAVAPERRGSERRGAKPGRDRGTSRGPDADAVASAAPGVEACLAVARDIDPNLAAQLEKVRQAQPALFASTIQRSRRLIALAELRERDASLYGLKILELKVDAQVSRIAARVTAARSEGRDSDARVLEEQLRQQVILQLAFRYRSRDDYLCRIREEVERLEKQLQWERDNFDEMLENRMRELVGTPAAASPPPQPGT